MTVPLTAMMAAITLSATARFTSQGELTEVVSRL
jgi:hypothetical protein